MMQKGIYMLIVMLLGVQLAWSQAAPRERENLAPMQNLEISMQRQLLTEPQLSSFSQRAVQKVKDVLGYMALMQDSSLDAQFRERAEQLAAQAFVSQESFLLFAKQAKSSGKLKNVTVISAFERKEGGVYLCELRLQWEGKSPEQRLLALLTQQPKQFGKEQSWSWEVKLVKGE